MRQLDLRPDAEQQAGNRKQKPCHVPSVKSVIHKLVLIDTLHAVFIQRNAPPLLE
jgi:hypothetical protein